MHCSFINISENGTREPLISLTPKCCLTSFHISVFQCLSHINNIMHKSTACFTLYMSHNTFSKYTICYPLKFEQEQHSSDNI